MLIIRNTRDIIINHATRVARELGVSKFMIGLTLVAFSTTLPELGGQKRDISTNRSFLVPSRMCFQY